MTAALRSLVKRGLLAAGYYRQALTRKPFPGVAVLCYHGVRDDGMPRDTLPLAYLHIPASRFESHCRVIRECCDPISLDDWRAAWNGRGALPARPVLITFDDGYRSVLTRALPILRRHGLPAAVFVCTSPMGGRRMLWFDHVAARDGEDAVEALKSKPYGWWREIVADAPEISGDDPRALLTPDELRTLADTPGIEIGGHTARHPILAHAPAADQCREIEQNLREIREWTGRTARAFAYPNGRPGLDYDAETVALLGKAGVDAAFTTRPAFAVAGEPALERSRFMMLDELTDAELAHRLAHSWPR